MSLETCPFCGKPFKRLKSHLPHCKMSPDSKTSKATNKPKGILSTTSKHTRNKDKTNEVNTKNTDSGSNLKSQVKSKKAEKARVDKDNKLLQNTAFTLTSTASKVLPTDAMDMDSLKHKTTWLAKREKEMFKQDKLRTQTRIKFTSVSQQEKNYSETFTTPGKDARILETKIVSGKKQASQISTHKINCGASEPLQRVSQSTDWQDNQLIPMCIENANVSVQIENIPSPLTKEYILSSRLKERCVSVFKTKTCVWDHIQYGLNRNRDDSVPVLFSRVTSHKGSFAEFVNASESVLKSHRGNGRNATVNVSSEQFPTLQSSVQRPVEDMLSLRFQNMSVLPYSPDMATGYGGTFSISSHSDISNTNALLKCQTSKPSPLSQEILEASVFVCAGLITELSLGDVRLNEIISWLGARTPKSPREAVSMLNKGWQWYYRKYIDVQKGGIGGIAMLIGSYCVLSYIWSYPHIKKDRWRKYH